MKMPTWLERAAPGTLGVFLGTTASSRKSGLFARHLCRRFCQVFVDPRSLSALHAADDYEAGEIDEQAFQAAVEPAVQAAEEAWTRLQGERDPQTGNWSDSTWAAYSAMTAANIARDVATRGYYKQLLADLGGIVMTTNSRHSTPKKRTAQAVRLVFFEHFGDIERPMALDPSWRTRTVVGLAGGIYAEMAFERMPILGDALQDAGCTEAVILDHCRNLDTHARGCWLVDALLGKS
jgi:hypothetical protein